MGDNGSKLSGVEKPALNTGGSGDLKTQKEKIGRASCRERV